MHRLRFLLGHLHVPGEIANNDYAKFWGVKEVLIKVLFFVTDLYIMVKRFG